MQIALNEAKLSEEKVKSQLHHVQEENARLKKSKEQVSVVLMKSYLFFEAFLCHFLSRFLKQLFTVIPKVVFSFGTCIRL